MSELNQDTYKALREAAHLGYALGVELTTRSLREEMLLAETIDAATMRQVLTGLEDGAKERVPKITHSPQKSPLCGQAFEAAQEIRGLLQAQARESVPA